MSTKPLSEMTDEEIMQLDAPPGVESVETSDDPAPTTEVTNDPADAGTVVEGTEGAAPAEVVDEAADPANTAATDAVTNNANPDPASAEQPAKVEGAEVVAAAGQPSIEDLQGFQSAILAPLKANGKTIEIKSKEEAIQLMQMGADYTRKLQGLRAHRKSISMLEQHGLLDEAKLSYLIDLSNGDPSAIQKLLKDRQVDPLDINVKEESTYQAHTQHVPSDAEVAFTTGLDELKASDDGQATIRVLNDWDQASKDLLYQNPEIMGAIHTQRANGTYDVVVAELERRRVFDRNLAGQPFIRAYHQVATELDAAKRQADEEARAAALVRKPVATVVAASKPAVTNAAKAAAASSTRSSGQKVTVTKNFLAMSDEEFAKMETDLLNRL